MTFIDQIERIRPPLSGTTLKMILDGDVDPGIEKAVDRLFKGARVRERIPPDIHTIGKIEETSRKLWGVSSKDVFTWCFERFDDPHLMQYFVFSFAVACI